MPNLGLHVGFALDCSEALGHPILQKYRGAFLLGSTTPDVRLFAGWDRERTHFFDLAKDPCGVGVEGMLKAHPHLRKSEALSRETVAFLLGYMTHLHTDETWIVQLWRRYFGKGSALAEDPMVLVLDRAFQFELDRLERQRVVDLEGCLESMKGAYHGVQIGFIDDALLKEWQGVVLDRVGRELSWDRFRGFIRRVSKLDDEDEIDAVIARVPQMLEKVRLHVRDSDVQTFRQNAVRSFVEHATAYLTEGRLE